MESGTLTRGNAKTGVRVDAVDVAGLDDASLDLRLRLIGRARNQLDGFLAEAVAEKKRRTTPYDTAEALKAELRQSGQQAQRTMREAEQLESLPAARRALTDSRITTDSNHLNCCASSSNLRCRLMIYQSSFPVVLTTGFPLR